MKSHHGFAPLLAAALLTSACVSDTSREQLHAALWMQQAVEYRGVAAQTYRLATARLDALLAPGSAAVEQREEPAAAWAARPPAIILDLDETVLDNSWFQARLVRDRVEYGPENWDAWVLEAAATAVPGAVEFLDAAAARGIRIFYVTNRECPKTPVAGPDPCPAKTATQRNLQALGLPGADDPSNLLLRRERPEWEASSKSLRRRWLGERYRIVALFGDDLQDFVDRKTFAERRAELEPLFGERWFALPNAMYGSWERTVIDGACPAGASAATCRRLNLERKYERLETEPPQAALRIATWNLEYLMEPATFAELAPRCVSEGSRVRGGDRAIPCSIVPRLARDAADFDALARYAARLSADVVALQEVDGAATASRLFPGHGFCFAGRAHVQKNGFAIRAGIPFRCESEYAPLSLGELVRPGVVVTLYPGTPRELVLMSVHLKSGCPAGPLTRAQPSACATLAAQVAPLEQWIDAQAAAGRRFAVLGDFNRRFAVENGAARDAEGRVVEVWPEIDDGEPAGARLTSLARTEPFQSCGRDDPYREYIDTVVFGARLAADIVPGSFVRIRYDDADLDAGRRLSDHCPVGVSLRLQ